MEPFETIEYKDFTIELHQDEDPQSPREDRDNFGKGELFPRVIKKLRGV